MSVKSKKEELLLSMSGEDRDAILEFLLESQILEYGITYLLTGLPYLNGPKLADISDKPLGALINEMEKTKDNRLQGLIEKTREFNELRKVVIHHLIHSDAPHEQMLKEIREKLKLAHDIQYEIEWHFNYLYDDLLGIPYGSIF